MRIGQNWCKKSAGFYSKHVLWNKPTLKASIDDINKRFKNLNVNIKNILTNIYIYIYVYTYRVMDKLPVEGIRRIYEYGSTSKIKFDKVLKQMMAHCFIYNCRICCKPYNNCCCYCVVCKTYPKFCQQICYDELSTYEDELKVISALGF